MMIYPNINISHKGNIYTLYLCGVYLNQSRYHMTTDAQTKMKVVEVVQIGELKNTGLSVRGVSYPVLPNSIIGNYTLKHNVISKEHMVYPILIEA